MVIEIRFRKTLFGDTFYDLYVNDVRLCGFYDLYVVFIRLHKWLKNDTNLYCLDGYELRLLNSL